MYKLMIVNGKYHMYRWNGKSYELIGKLSNTQALEEFCYTFAPNIKEGEIQEAIKYMVKDNHNAAEFGIKGCFTVSFKE